jgi:hypothetical protein
VTAIDFVDAFGSVPHRLIRLKLQQPNFTERIKTIIEDMYQDAKSTIEHKRRQAFPIRWKKEPNNDVF